MKVNVFYTVAALTLIWFLSACKKEIKPVLPGNGNSVKINYFTNSDLLSQYYSFGRVLVDSVINTSTTYALPFFNLQRGQQVLEAPKIYSPTAGLIYGNYNPGERRFVFMLHYGKNKQDQKFETPATMLADATVKLNEQSENLVYLIDGPVKSENAEPQFKVITLPASRDLKIDNNTVAVIIAHQSPDAQALRCSRVKTDGSLSTENLPQNLNYGQSTPFLLFNIKEASNGIIGLKFFDKVSGTELVNTAVPANGGHAYVLSVLGFQQAHSFKLPSKMNDDNTVEYTNTTVTANLRGISRQIW